jgi:DNA-binding winged helix-turn-helix (wHTH) protein
LLGFRWLRQAVAEVSFGEFVLDGERRQLRRAGEEVRLVPKAFELLALLVNERPRAVSKERIRDRLWPKTFVSEATLTSLVVDLRAALGDEAKRPRYVRTVHRFGYAFCGEASDAPPAPRQARGVRLWLRWGDREIPPSVSRRHARVVVSKGRASIEDLGSKNGTFVGGERIQASEPRRLVEGDEIRLGRVRLSFEVSAGFASTQSVAP